MKKIGGFFMARRRKKEGGEREKKKGKREEKREEKRKGKREGVLLLVAPTSRPRRVDAMTNETVVLRASARSVRAPHHNPPTPPESDSSNVPLSRPLRAGGGHSG